MVYRKVVKQGPMTLLTSLPRNWIVENGIQKGDLVRIDNKGNYILISPASKKRVSLKKTIIAEIFYPEILRRFYRQNYDQVIIKTNETNKRRYKKFVDLLIGADVIEEKGKELTIIFGDSNFSTSYDDIFKQVLKTTCSRLEKLEKQILNDENLVSKDVFDEYNFIIKQIDYYIRKNRNQSNIDKQMFETQILDLIENIYYNIYYLTKRDFEFIDVVQGKEIIVRYLDYIKNILTELPYELSNISFESERKLVSRINLLQEKLFYHLNKSIVTGNLLFLNIMVLRTIKKIVRKTAEYRLMVENK